MIRRLWALLLVAAPAAGATPLTLEEVLDSSRNRHPATLALEAGVAEREGQRLSRRGAFDRRLELTAGDRLTGYYDGGTAGIKLVQPLTDYGAQLYGGYRRSAGEFPVYEDEQVTLSAGEVKLGLVLSLLRDRDIDSRRAALADAGLLIERARLDLQLERVRVQRDAMLAYSEWVAAGQALGIYETLLRNAEQRQSGFQTRVAEGDLPRAMLNENLQSILRRRSLLVEAQRRLATAANRLSLFLRDDQGQPQVVQPERLPAALDLPEHWPDQVDVEVFVRAALSVRPELGVVSTDLQRERLRLAQGRNQLQPRLDLNLEAARDNGDGPDRRSGTDSRIRLDLSIPLQTRAADGEIAAAEARIDALQLRGRLLEERIRTEVQTLHIQLDAARESMSLAEQEREQADLLVSAERERFAEGASDFFLVNLREEAAASAAVSSLQKRKAAFDAAADLYAATLQQEPLGLAGG